VKVALNTITRSLSLNWGVGPVIACLGKIKSFIYIVPIFSSLKFTKDIYWGKWKVIVNIKEWGNNFWADMTHWMRQLKKSQFSTFSFIIFMTITELNLKWITSIRLICSCNSITQILLCKRQCARYLQVKVKCGLTIDNEWMRHTDILLSIIRKCFRLFYLIFPKSKYYWRYTFF
jgi:hypothetical protein